MAGSIDKSHSSYNDFQSGVDTRNTPMTAVDRKILDFAMRMSQMPAEKTHGQILRNFGMYPPEFWNRAQRLSGHPDLSQREKTKLAYIFPDPARPGPMEGGAPIKTDGKSFSHGVEW